MTSAEFGDARLVEVYDAENTWGPDDAFFLSVATAEPGARVLDLGCGTGRLTLAIAAAAAAAGHDVTGIDPAAASLAAARVKPGADRVTWIEGTSSVLRAAPPHAPLSAAPFSAAPLLRAPFDVAVMTAHVAQIFLTDDAWAAVLADLATALRPGATLAFDSRDPSARVWEQWHARAPRRITLAGGRGVVVDTEVTSADGEVASFTHHYAFDDGLTLSSDLALRFRTEAALRSSLRDAGFAVDDVLGGWAGEPVGAGDGEFVVLARRR